MTDWRSGHYGADKLAHAFDYIGGHRARPICGVRLPVHDTYRKVETPIVMCRECLRRLYP